VSPPVHENQLFKLINWTLKQYGYSNYGYSDSGLVSPENVGQNNLHHPDSKKIISYTLFLATVQLVSSPPSIRATALVYCYRGVTTHLCWWHQRSKWNLFWDNGILRNPTKLHLLKRCFITSWGIDPMHYATHALSWEGVRVGAK
jgi:hypothetical protein